MEGNMARKTIEVGKLIAFTNNFLKAKNTTADEREAVASMLETVLFETGNYKGFRYLDTDETEGAGSRRYYFVNGPLTEDYDKESRDINIIRV
jgi:hypothetical protein